MFSPSLCDYVSKFKKFRKETMTQAELHNIPASRNTCKRIGTLTKVTRNKTIFLISIFKQPVLFRLVFVYVETLTRTHILTPPLLLGLLFLQARVGGS